MVASHYNARVARLVGPGRTTFFAVELEPPDRPQGQVSRERVLVVIQEDRNARPERVAAAAREVLASMAAGEWSIVPAK